MGSGQISFLDTLGWLLSATPGETPPPLLINPRRPDRQEPRVLKDWRDDTQDDTGATKIAGATGRLARES